MEPSRMLAGWVLKLGQVVLLLWKVDINMIHQSHHTNCCPTKPVCWGCFIQLLKSSGYVIFVFNPQAPGSGCLCVLGFPDCAQGMVQYQNVGLSKGSGPRGGIKWTKLSKRFPIFLTFRKSLADLCHQKNGTSHRYGCFQK